MFQTKSFSQSSFSTRSWRLYGGVVVIYNVVRVYVTTVLKRTAIRAGKRTVTITEGVTHGRW